MEMDNTYSINVGEGVLGLSMLGQHARGNLVNLADQLEHRVIRQVAKGKLALADVTRVRPTQDGVTVTRHHLSGLQGRPEEFGDGLVAQIVADDLLHVGEPVQHLLVGQSVQRTGQTVETGGQRQEGGAQRRSDQMRGVGADVATLVVRVDGQVQPQQLDEVVVLAKAQLVGQVEGVVLVLLDGGDLAVLENVAVDLGGDGGQLGDQVHRILERVGPVVLLVDSLGVGLGEGRFVLQRRHGQRELGHGVEVAGATVQKLFDELGHVRTSRPFGRQVTHLLFRGDVSG